MANLKIKTIFFLIVLGFWVFSGRAWAATGILTVSVTGNGSISSVGLYSPTFAGSSLGSVGSINGIACGLDCSEEYSLYSVVDLVATPISPNVVGQWTGCSVSKTDPNTCTATVLGNTAVSIQFAAPHAFYTLTVSKSAGGNVTGTGIDCGTDCYYTVDISGNRRFDYAAAPISGYGFSGWSGDTALCGTNLKCTLVIDPGIGTDQGAPLADAAEANFAPLVCSATKSVTATFNTLSCLITATPSSVASGQSAELNWSSTNASNATLNQVDVGLSGIKFVNPANTTTYTLTVRDASGNSNLCSVTVTVGAPATPPIGPGKFLPKKIREILPF